MECNHGDISATGLSNVTFFNFQFNYGSPQPHPGGSSYLPYGAPAASVPGYPPNAPVMGGNAPPIGFNPLVLEGAGTCKA